MNESVTQADFLEAFGINSSADAAASEETVNEEAAEETQEEQEEQEEANAEQEESEQDSEQEADKTPTTKGPSAEEKAAYAYAQLRNENAKTKKLLSSVAELLGIDSKQNSDDLENILKEKIIEAQAQKTNIPADILKKLEHLEQRDDQFRKEQLKQMAYLGFQKVKTEFGLDEKQLQAFATELVNEGKNPFEQEYDLQMEYLRKNWKTMIQQAEDRAAQAEAARAAKAQSQGTTPSGKNGKQMGAQGKIDSIAALEKFLNSQ